MAVERSDILPYHLPNGVTYHWIYRATPLLSNCAAISAPPELLLFYFTSVDEGSAKLRGRAGALRGRLRPGAGRNHLRGEVPRPAGL